MDDGKRSGSRRLKERLASLLRPAANSLLRSACGSSTSSTSTALTATTNASTAAISTSSSTNTTAASYTTTSGGALVPGAEPFSAALDRLPYPPQERSRKPQHKEGWSSSSHHSSRRRPKNVDIRTLASNPYGFTSSDDDGDEDGTFGHSDDDEDMATLFSSRSLMTFDSSGFYTSKKKPQPHKNQSYHTRHRRPQRRRRRAAASCVENCNAAGAVREPGFRPLVLATAPATAEAAARVRKGLAVVKRSRDPYGDFQESMVEMIVGRQVFGAAELERLLRSYLSLNAPRLHPIILQAFSDIWVVLHGG